MTPRPTPAAGRPAKRLLRFFLAAHFFFPIAWLWSQMTAEAPDRRDWYYLRLAGDRFLNGDWSSIYSSVDAGFLWRYPPFALFLAAVLALLDPESAYWLTVIVAIGSLAATLWLLRITLRPNDFGLVVLAIATSAAFTSVLVTGQSSSLIALVISAGLFALLRGNQSLSYAFFGLLAIKPNWLPFFVLYALLRRSFKGLAIMAAISATVVAVALPLRLTDDFITASLNNGELLTNFPAFKLITSRSLVDVLTDSAVIWPVVLVVLTACGIYLWRPSAATPLPRQIAAVVLITITANPYVAFYDGLVIMIPATVWWATRGTYSSRTAWRIIGALIALIWVWDQAVFYYLPLTRSLGFGPDGTPGFSLVGPALALWVLVETFDVRTRLRLERSVRPAA